jgi:hypothetical protein
VSRTKGKRKKSVVTKLSEVWGKHAVAYMRDARVRPVGSMSFLLRHGKGIPRKVLDRFFHFVRVERSSLFINIIALDGNWETIERGGCWLWTGARDVRGYGNFWLDRRNHKAHVLANLWFRGPKRDETKELHHECGMRNCVNPAHLTLMDHSLNCLIRNPIRVETKKGRSKVFRPGPIDVEADAGAEVVVEWGMGDPADI